MSKGSIQDIIIKRKNVRRTTSSSNNPDKKDIGIIDSKFPHTKTKSHKNRWIFILIALIFIFFAGFLAFSQNEKVVIEVTPKSQKVTVDFTATAHKNIPSDDSDLSFSIYSTKESRTANLKSVGTKEVEKRAEGTIIIFNNYSSDPQRLVARTRFETPDGKIFRISDAVTVPGVVVREGKTIPGSIEAKVRAEEPGEDYNVGYADLTIPGLKGTPLYDKIYARTKTELTGGFSGTINIVDENEQKVKRSELQKEITDALFKKIENEVDDNFLVIKDGVFIDFSEKLEDEVGNSESESIKYTIEGSADIVLLNKKELARLIAEEGGVEISENEQISLKDASDLLIIIKDKDSFSPTEDEYIDIVVSGTARIVWDIPEEEIKNALAGKEKAKSVYQSIFASQFPNIVEAQVVEFTPFWSRKFPTNPEKIQIISSL